MASKLAFLAFLLVFIASSCLADRQQHQQQRQNQCQIRDIQALQPTQTVRAEAGVTEFWDADNQAFRCAGVDFIRHRIQPGGLLLPSYVNAPILYFVETGRGVQGVILPGCPETYEYSPQDQQQQQRPGQQQDRPGHQQDRRGQQFQIQADRHQKVQNVNEGDVVAVPTGAAHWLHNNGNTELVVVVFFDIQSNQNQLDDDNHRRFFLAGNPQAQSQQQQPRGQSRREQPAHNIFFGLDAQLISELFNIRIEIAEKLRGERDQRGHIVNAGQQLEMIQAPQTQQQHQQSRRTVDPRSGAGGESNGFDQTVCSLKLKENIDNPSHADFVNPQAGIIANINNFKFPILKLLQLSVERGYLRRNAIQSPHWTINAHNLLYVTDGTLRVQIVNNEGNSVFNDELREGQVVVIPQNFAVIKRAGEQGARWISFKTNENAMIENLAGRLSAIRSMPVAVVAKSFQLSIEDAQRLKFSRQEAVLFTPRSSRDGEWALA